MNPKKLESNESADYELKRALMVARQIEARGIRDPDVLDAMRKVPRHIFVDTAQRSVAYEDRPLAIVKGQTISQPYIVALMTELLHLKPSMRVLEIGTGCGYQSAVLAHLVEQVYSIELDMQLYQLACKNLKQSGYAEKVDQRCGDGHSGWPEWAPFDAILVAAAPVQIPPILTEQLQIGGRLVIPIGAAEQDLYVITRTQSGFEKQSILPVRFVPMIASSRPDS